MNFILSIDQGTTGTTITLIDTESFQLKFKVTHEFAQIYPKPGWVEHDLDDIWNTIEFGIKKILSDNNIKTDQITCIGITNQRETVCALHSDGTPIRNAIVWQDRRTSEFCKSIKRHNDTIFHKTGLPIDPYFSASKMTWLWENDPYVKKAASENDLRLCNIDSYILMKLTNGHSFYTEPSNASRTMLFDINQGDWDDDLCDLFKVQTDFLPQIKNSFDHFGVTQDLGFLQDGIPITGILGDQQAALFGQGCTQSGQMKCTYGTGSFLLLNTGEDIVHSKNGLVTTIAYRYNNIDMYAIEGSCYIAGAAVQWLRDNLAFFETSEQIEQLAKGIESLDKVKDILFLPFFTGIGSPYWKADARASILGLTRDSGKSEISRACLEGIALSINDLITSMEKDTGRKIESLKVDGGACINNLLMQIQSNLSLCTIIRPKIIETTSYGAGLAAAIGNDLLNFNNISKFWKEDAQFLIENKDQQYYSHKKQKWEQAIKALY